MTDSADNKRFSAPRGVAGWMLFDWAAQPFFTVVTTFVFGPYFVSRMAPDPVTGQTAWAWGVAAAGLLIAVLSPLLGAVADFTGWRKRWIVGLAFVKVSCLCALWWAAPGSSLWWVVAVFALATVAAELSVVFNDAMLPTLVPMERVGQVSSFAWGLGFLGGMIALMLVIGLLAPMPGSANTLAGVAPLLPLDTSAGEDARITGPLAASWYAIFILPMLLFTPDTRSKLGISAAMRDGLRSLGASFRELRDRAGLLRFLIARMFYQDGVNAVLALGGGYAAALFDWSLTEVGVFGILLNVTAILGCWLASRLDRYLGSRRIVMWAVLALCVGTGGISTTGARDLLLGLVDLGSGAGEGLFATSAEQVYLGFGALIGLAFGPVQSASRSYLAESVSAEEAGRYFGIYALTGRATSFVAPASVALVTAWTGSAQAGISIIVLFFVIGALILRRVPRSPADQSRPGLI